MRYWISVTVVALAVISGGFIDGSVAHAPDVPNPGCYEDEVIVKVVAGWTGTHFEPGLSTGWLVCVPWDDIDLDRVIAERVDYSTCEALGYAPTDSGLADCADHFGLDCGDPYTDHLRESCP